jgi:surface protein
MNYLAAYKGTDPIVFIDPSNVNVEWTRPAWPALDDLTSTDNVFTGIYGVEDHDSNFVSILIVVSTGTWSVDWGDGTVETGLASNVKRDHLYNYSSIAATPIDGFKPVVVKVTTSGGNMTTINLQQKHSQAGLPTSSFSCNWLDIALNASLCSTLNISSSTLPLTKLKKAKIYNHADTSLGIFSSCYALEDVNLFDTQNVTSMAGMFQNCYSLKKVPLFDTRNVANMSNMFFNCYSLRTVPLFNTQNVNNMSSMFQGCHFLQSVPQFNTAKVTDMSSMFASCFDLKSIPLFNTQNVSLMNAMFSTCVSLKSVPQFLTTGVTTMLSMFSSCYSLQSVPLFDTRNVNIMTSMFQTCYNLTGVPLFDTANVTSMNSMFANADVLFSVPGFNTKNLTSALNMFNSCDSLLSTPTLNCTGISSAANIAGIFTSTRNLAKANMSGIRYSISYGTGMLSTQAINTIFSGLGTAVGASGTQTIEVRGNYGYSGADKSIAEAKGWLVL